MRKLIYILFALFLVNACSAPDDIVFSESDSYISFGESGLSVSESRLNENKEKEDNELEVPIYWATTNPNGTTVELEVITEDDQISIPAIEGVDFTLETKVVKFEKGELVQKIIVRTIDNDEETGSKKFILKLKSTTANSTLGSEGDGNDQIMITIIDDEHPLYDLFGDYTMTYKDHTGEDNEFKLTIESIENNKTAVALRWLDYEVYETTPIKVLGKLTETGFELEIATPQMISAKYSIGVFAFTGSAIRDNISVLLSAPLDASEIVLENNLSFGLFQVKEDGRYAVETPVPNTVKIVRQ